MAIPVPSILTIIWEGFSFLYIERRCESSVHHHRPDANGIFKMWTESRGLAGADYDGIMGDEFSGSGHGGVGNYPLYAEAVKRIAEDPRFKGKVFYPACMPMYTSDLSMDFLKAVVTPGYKWCEEKYLTEQPTEPAAVAPRCVMAAVVGLTLCRASINVQFDVRRGVKTCENLAIEQNPQLIARNGVLCRITSQHVPRVRARHGTGESIIDFSPSSTSPFVCPNQSVNLS
jgi:hypothetical protein